MSGLTYIFVIAGWKCLFWNFRSLNVFFWTPPGPEVTPASSDSTSAGQRKPCSREEYFPGDVSHHQRALHTLIVWWRNQPHSVSTGLFSLQMILSSGISLWMGLRSWMSLQEVNHPQDWGPVRLGITRCRHAVRPLREPQADLHRRLHRTVEDKVTDSSDLRIRTSIRRDQVRFNKSSCWFAGRSLWSSVSFFSTLQVKPSVRTDKDSTWRNADWTLEIWCCCSTASTLCRIQLYDFYYCLFILMWTVI